MAKISNSLKKERKTFAAGPRAVAPPTRRPWTKSSPLVLITSFRTITNLLHRYTRASSHFCSEFSIELRVRRNMLKLANTKNETNFHYRK